MKTFYKGTYPSKTTIKMLNTKPEELEFYFIDVFLSKIKVKPIHGILGNVFILCKRLDNNEMVTIYYKRLQWEKNEITSIKAS